MPKLELTIGQATFTLAPTLPVGPSIIFNANFWALLLRYPREIYRWSCKTKTGRPDPRPASFRIDADIFFIGDELGAYFSFDHPALLPYESEQQSLERLLRSTGAGSAEELQKALDQLFGFTDMPIPYAELLDPFAEKTSRLITAREEYMRFRVMGPGFDPPADAGRIPRACFLMVPLSVTFESQIVGVCDGGDPARGFGLMAGRQVPIELTDAGRAAAKAYQAALDRVLFEDQ